MLRVLGDPVEIRLYGMAERGEGDERLALKKGAAQRPLQSYDGVGQRGLGDGAASGRSCEIALLAERQEVADLVHLHGSTSRNQSRSHGSLPSTSAFDGEVAHRAALFIAELSHHQARATGWAGGRQGPWRRMQPQRAFKGFAPLRSMPGLANVGSRIDSHRLCYNVPRLNRAFDNPLFAGVFHTPAG